MTSKYVKAHLGFSLLELVTVVAVIGILAVIAVPAYSNYVRSAKIQDAFTTLAALQTKQKLYWSDNRNYGTTDCAIGALPANTKYFSFICNINNSLQGYLITAKGKGDLLNYNFTIDQDGNRVTVDFPGISPLPIACWLSKPGVC